MCGVVWKAVLWVKGRTWWKFEQLQMFLHKFGHVVFGEHSVSSSNSSLCFAFPLTHPMQAPLVVEARSNVVYLCCFIHGSVILQISLEKNIFFLVKLLPSQQILPSGHAIMLKR